MFTSEQVVKYLSKNPYKNVEFINCKNKNIHVFKCRDSSIGCGELGNGAIYDFDMVRFKDDMWFLGFNPYV